MWAERNTETCSLSYANSKHRVTRKCQKTLNKRLYLELGFWRTAGTMRFLWWGWRIVKPRNQEADSGTQMRMGLASSSGNTEEEWIRQCEAIKGRYCAYMWYPTPEFKSIPYPVPAVWPLARDAASLCPSSLIYKSRIPVLQGFWENKWDKSLKSSAVPGTD